MVTPPLSTCPVVFLTVPRVELPKKGDCIFDMLPFNNDTWRRWCGLTPLEDDETREDGDGGGGKPGSVNLNQVGRWLSMTDEGYQSLKAKKGWRNTAELIQLGEMLVTLRDRAQHNREGCLQRVTKIPNYNKFFGEKMLAMLNRRGGVMEEIRKVMEQHKFSVKHVWLDEYDSNSKRPKEHQVSPETLKIPSLGDTSKFSGDVCKRLFGADSVKGFTGNPEEEYAKVVDALLRRAWERFRRQLLAMIKIAVESKQNFAVALDAASADPTANGLRACTRLLKSWKDIAELTGEAETSEFKHRERDLDQLWEQLGYGREADGEVVSKKRTKAHNPLITDQEMAQAYQHYLETYLSAPDESIEALFETLKERLESDEDSQVDLVGDDTEDLGVAEYAKTSESELDRLLDLVDSSFPFGETGEAGNPEKPRILPRWHQKVFVVVALKNIFTKEKGEDSLPTYLCDDVGLGKTVMTVGIISMIAHCIECQKNNKPLPPLLTESGRTYFSGREEFPSLPHLFVTPRTLSIQLEREIAKFTEKGAFRVLVYSRKIDREVFFGPGGDWDKVIMESEHRHRTIIIAEISTLAAEAKECLSTYTPGAGGKIDLFRGDPPEVTIPNPSLTIFTKSFAFAAFDETHVFRNQNSASYAVLRLAANSISRVALTATPIFTGVKDLTAQGRLLRYKPMIGEQGVELGLQMERSQKEREKLWRDNPDDLMKQMSTLVLKERATESQPGPQSNQGNIVVTKHMTEMDKRTYKTAYACRESVQLLREKFLPIVVRRTSRSVMPDGKPVMELERYVESTVWTVLTVGERGLLDSLTDRLVNSDDKESVKIIKWKNFLLDYKNAVFHSMLLNTTEGEHPGRFWEQWTRDNINEQASSKILQVCSLVDHYDDPSAQPLFFHRDGSRDYKREAKNKYPPAKRPRKIVIFIMYEIQRIIMKKVLELKGRKCLEYDGKMSLKTREQAIKSFDLDDDVKIMLISNVGTTGLNMVMASILILLSGQWSSSEKAQTIGRVWRQGQLEQVIAYNVICPDTPDELIDGYAASKLMIKGWFMKGQLASDVFDSTDSDSQDETPLQTEEEQNKDARRARTKVRSRTLKGANDVQATQSQVENTAQVSKGDPGPGTSSRKRKASKEVGPAPEYESSHGDRQAKSTQRAPQSKKRKTSKSADAVDIQAKAPGPGPTTKKPEADGCEVEMPSFAASQPIGEQISSMQGSLGSIATTIAAPPRGNREVPVLPVDVPGLTGAPKEAGKGKQRADLVPCAGPNRMVSPPANKTSSHVTAEHIDEDVDVGVDVGELNDLFDVDGASGDWANAPATETPAASSLSTTRLAQVQASEKSGKPAVATSTSIEPSRLSKPMLSPFRKTSESPLSRGLSATRPVASGSAKSSTQRSAPNARLSVLGSSSQLSSAKPIVAVSEKRPGQFKQLKKSSEQLPPSQTAVLRQRITEVDRTDERYQRGQITPRSPSRGRKPRPSTNDLSGSPPAETGRRR